MAGAYIRTEDGTSAIYKHSCKFNEGVDCGTINRHCEKCGWDPKVAQDRLEKFCKERGIALPLPQRTEDE